MAKSKDTEQKKDEAPAEEEVVVETYYDDEDGAEPGVGWKKGACVADSACAAMESVQDAVLKAMPEKAAEHLVNSHNELLKAGMAFFESAIEKAEKVRERSREVRGPKDA